MFFVFQLTSKLDWGKEGTLVPEPDDRDEGCRWHEQVAICSLVTTPHESSKHGGEVGKEILFGRADDQNLQRAWHWIPHVAGWRQPPQDVWNDSLQVSIIMDNLCLIVLKLKATNSWDRWCFLRECGFLYNKWKRYLEVTKKYHILQNPCLHSHSLQQNRSKLNSLSLSPLFWRIYSWMTVMLQRLLN